MREREAARECLESAKTHRNSWNFSELSKLGLGDKGRPACLPSGKRQQISSGNVYKLFAFRQICISGNKRIQKTTGLPTL